MISILLNWLFLSPAIDIKAVADMWSSTLKASLGPTEEDTFRDSIKHLSPADQQLLLREWARARE